MEGKIFAGQSSIFVHLLFHFPLNAPMPIHVYPFEIIQLLSIISTIFFSP